METALIVSNSEKSIAVLSNMLAMTSITKIATAASAGAARRLLIEQDYDLTIINAPLPDEYGESLSKSIASHGVSEVILLVRAEMYEEISSKVEDLGIIAVAKPIHKVFFWNAIKITQAAHRKVQIMQQENRKLVQKIEDIKVVDRAKWVLVRYLNMSESEAHRYIEKQAMDMRLTKRLVAEEILKTYEN